MTGRVGLELELLAPKGKSRRTLAERFARAAGGEVHFGLKYSSPGRGPDGKPRCELTPAFRVQVRGRTVATLVDDSSLAAQGSRPGPQSEWSGTTDDVRLALLAESVCWSEKDDVGAIYAPLARLFGGDVERTAGRGTWGAVVDAVGHPLVRGVTLPVGRERACEVVLEPVAPSGLARAVEPWLELARKLDFSVPKEAALHAHFDAASFRRTPRLRRLILRWAQERDAWRRLLSPNPHCTQLGPAPPAVVRVAREADESLPFATFAAALLLAGAHKACDFNLLGVLEKRPRHPTLEVRCLPMSLESDAVLASVERAAALLWPGGLSV